MHNATYKASLDATVELYPDFPYIQATPEEIASMKSREPVKCLCSTCGKQFYIQKNQLLARIKHNCHTAFCSRQCSSEHQKMILVNSMEKLLTFVKIAERNMMVLMEVEDFAQHGAPDPFQEELPPLQKRFKRKRVIR